ncbi:MAG: arginase family protein [Kiloniellales bacterium]|nr:arginase family protein [Kiloniellales bacterium]
MKVRLIQAPYDTALYDTRMGRGPGRLLEGGAVERLEALGHEVSLGTVDPRPELPAEVATGFAVMRGVADEVRKARASKAFPLVLAGNCNTAVGTVSGLAPRRIAALWFDAHADFNTPDSSTSGFLDGMGLAILTGHCWRALAESVPGYAPVPEERVILAGARDFDARERERLAESRITCLSDRDLNDGGIERRLGDALDRLAPQVDAFYLHVDLDVHDPRIAPANHFRPPGGVTPERLRELVAFISRRVPVAAAYLGAYDPDVDPQGVTLGAGLALLETIVSEASDLEHARP